MQKSMSENAEVAGMRNRSENQSYQNKLIHQKRVKWLNICNAIFTISLNKCQSEIHFSLILWEI
jgi:hypothetical protein